MKERRNEAETARNVHHRDFPKKTGKYSTCWNKEASIGTFDFPLFCEGLGLNWNMCCEDLLASSHNILYEVRWLCSMVSSGLFQFVPKITQESTVWWLQCWWPPWCVSGQCLALGMVTTDLNAAAPEHPSYWTAPFYGEYASCVNMFEHLSHQ